MFDTLIKIANSKEHNPESFIALIKNLRPSGNNKEVKIVEKVNEFLTTLEKDEYIRKALAEYLCKIFNERKFSRVITETGIIKSENFFSELKMRIGHKLLPQQTNEDSLSYLLSNIFYRSEDYKWVNAIKYEQWEKFFELMNFKPLAAKSNQDFVIQEMITSIEILSLRISGEGVDDDLLAMVPEYKKLESPFISLAKEANTLSENLRKDENVDRTVDSIDIKQLLVIINQCNEYVVKVVKNRVTYGITFATTVKVARLKQQLERLELALNFLSINRDDKKYHETIDFIENVIELTCTKNDIGAFINYSTGLVAYQITQHTGKTGEHYITNSKSEYNKMLFSALGGGFVVAILCLIKTLLSYNDYSPLGTAFVYSMNYAIGFIIIYLMGFTLATKQPAMTAVTLAQTIDSKGKKPDYTAFSKLFTKLFRSQFIAFVGNVFMAFPIALILGYLWIQYFGYNPIKTYKAEKLLFEINPFLSLALFHAAIAGFYLFLSGLISGYYMNNNIHYKISYRFKRHPVLRSIFPEKLLNAIANFYDKKVGGISGNFWFGIFLGSTGMIGYFIGLPIDIRHIAFAAGNFALALVGLEFTISFWDVILSILCIGFIGFFNFIVSFMLSLLLAMRSRKIPIRNIKYMLIAVWEAYKLNPKYFWWPPNELVLNDIEEDDISEQSKTNENRSDVKKMVKPSEKTDNQEE